MSDQSVEEFLEHVGVKGMKWGVRKKRGNRDNFRKAALNKPKAKDLSDEQLRAAINRMQLEKQYNQLSNSEKNSKSAVSFIAKHGSKIVGTAVTAFATQQVGSALNKAAAKAAAKTALKKSVGS